MNHLKNLHSLLGQNAFDHLHLSEIKQLYVDLLSNLDKEKDAEVLRLADLEWKALNIRKSFDYKEDASEGRLDGLSWQLAGTKTLEDGTVLPHYWPDVVALTDNDFKYFEEVWQESKNDFIKAEFGLLVYFGKRTTQSRKQQFAKELFGNIFDLTSNYEKKIETHQDFKSYYAYFINNTKLLAGIAFRSKLKQESHQLADYLLQVYQNSTFIEKGLISVYAEISSLIAHHFSHFKNLLSLDDLIEKNLLNLKKVKEKDLWAGISLINQTKKLREKQKKEFNDLLLEKALIYEQLAIEAEKTNPAAISAFIIDAMKLYKSAGDEDGFRKMQQLYTKKRGELQLSEFEYEIPKEFMDDMDRKIKETISESDENNILIHWIMTPWYSSYKDIESNYQSTKDQSPLLSITPVAVLDKYGNVIARYTSNEEIEKYNILTSYNYNFQLGTAIMVKFVFAAMRAGKLTFHSLMNYLVDSWIDEPLVFTSQNKQYEIKPVDTLKPVFVRFFIETGNYIANTPESSDLVTLTDSLTLKVEQLLRQFCFKANIPTFKRKKGTEDIMMEKTLDELLAELENKPEAFSNKNVNFNEDHRQMLKFVLTEKGGWNLRNEVAHGLLDINDYTIEKPIVLMSLILKLSSYKFSIE